MPGGNPDHGGAWRQPDALVEDAGTGVGHGLAAKHRVVGGSCQRHGRHDRGTGRVSGGNEHSGGGEQYGNGEFAEHARTRPSRLEGFTWCHADMYPE